MMLPRILAGLAAFSLAASPALGQPPQDPANSPEGGEHHGMKGEIWGYLALPALIVVVILLAALRGEDEDGPISP